MLLFDLPELLGDVLTHVFAGDSDLETQVARSTDGSLADATKQYGPDIVVSSIDSIDQVLIETLETNPRLKIFNVRSHGRETRLCELQPDCRSLGQLAPEDFIERIHELVAAPFALRRGRLR